MNDITSPYELLIELRENKILYQYFATGAVIIKEDNSWVITGESDQGEARVIQLSSGVLRITLPLYVDPKLPLEALEKVILGMQETMEGILMMEFTDDSVQGIYGIHTTLEGLDLGLRKFIEESREFKATVKNIIKNITAIKENMAKSFKDQMEAAGLKSDGVPPKMKDLEENTSVWNAIKEIDSSVTKEEPPIEPEELDEEDLADYLDDEIDFNPPRPFEDNEEENPWFKEDDKEDNDPGPWVD